ncbi:beta-ketoacyl-ACP synthase III [Actinoplanes sp. N902-109]|uniref:beta-ketoacyl-ACP synthase III n=1 Tax=Actinoplanes sp. (strain N902-109) TaxID=649831 RepID=UPI000329399A|nr:beta-ketoacyl-ACP synthase III [Actinoplanes sp. N902-109]AGL16534.1 3-oxoacyl-(acyl carrier protein) synthase III [Actinoplanes sp. N902-109]
MSRAAVLAGLGTHVPSRVVTNDDLAGVMDTSDEWIRSRTGIAQRHWAEPGIATGDLAVEAGGRALKSAGSGDVDLVVVATTTPDHPCPATAPEVAHRLGLNSVAAYDIAAVCSGFVYALASAAGAIAAGIAERVLVIGAETYSTILDPQDRATSVIFGDGAGAVVLRAGEPSEPGALLGLDLGSDGSLKDLIIVPAGGSRMPAAAPGESGARPAGTYFHMQGKPVFRHAVTRMAASSRAVLDAAGWTPESVDWFVGHQANVRILHAVADQLGMARERTVVNLDRVGNTSAASIPLALGDAVSAGLLNPGDRVLMSAFGGGLTWGSTALVWPAVEAG